MKQRKGQDKEIYEWFERIGVVRIEGKKIVPLLTYEEANKKILEELNKWVGEQQCPECKNNTLEIYKESDDLRVTCRSCKYDTSYDICRGVAKIDHGKIRQERAIKETLQASILLPIIGNLQTKKKRSKKIEYTKI